MFWPFEPTSCFLLEHYLTAGGGKHLHDREVGSENDGRGPPATGQNPGNYYQLLTKELKPKLNVWGRLCSMIAWKVLLTCDHVQSNVEDEVKSEMENTDMDNTGKSCSNPSLMSAFNRSAFSESCNYYNTYNKFNFDTDRNEFVSAMLFTGTRGRCSAPGHLILMNRVNWAWWRFSWKVSCFPLHLYHEVSQCSVLPEVQMVSPEKADSCEDDTQVFVTFSWFLSVWKNKLDVSALIMDHLSLLRWTLWCWGPPARRWARRGPGVDGSSCPPQSVMVVFGWQ